jgi:HSP20 family protein
MLMAVQRTRQFSKEFYELTMPAIDMCEDGNDLVVKIDLAGFAKRDINLSIEEDILRIRAKRESEEKTHTGSDYYKHRPHQIDKGIILPISVQDGKKVAGAAAYVFHNKILKRVLLLLPIF